MNQLSDQQLGVMLIALRRLQDDLQSRGPLCLQLYCEDYDIEVPTMEDIDDLCVTINTEILDA